MPDSGPAPSLTRPIPERPRSSKATFQNTFQSTFQRTLLRTFQTTFQSRDRKGVGSSSSSSRFRAATVRERFFVVIFAFPSRDRQGAVLRFVIFALLSRDRQGAVLRFVILALLSRDRQGAVLRVVIFALLSRDRQGAVLRVVIFALLSRDRKGVGCFNPGTALRPFSPGAATRPSKIDTLGSAMRRQDEAFASSELALVYIAKRLKEAKRLEDLLTTAGVDYLVETDTYRGGFIFVSERVGAFFYVQPAAEAHCRELMTQNRFKPYEKTPPDVAPQP
jgi:hypothetical protein